MPFVSIIITAHNEQERINEKIENTLAISYPADRREIIVASDASSDATDDLVRGWIKNGQPISLVGAAERRGKEHAQALAIAKAKGEILVFSDVSTVIPPGALRAMVENFDGPRVGAVSSEDRFLTPDGSVAGEGVYVRYEMWLRRLETRKHGIVGLSGSFFAARRAVCQDWDIHTPSDFNTALNCARLGYVAVSDPNVCGHYPNIKDERREYARKVRTVTRGLAGLARHVDVLNPFKYGMFAYQVWSHKVMRWAVPWFMLLALVSSWALASRHWIYAAAFIAQAALYLLALIVRGRAAKPALLKIPFFFVQVNMAIAHATLAFLVGKRVTVWEPSKR
jgi:glycosyltransferase involved in cell wall biosynthesis